MKLSRTILIAALLMPMAALAQPTRPATPPSAADKLEFTVVKENPITSIKNQNRSGTCWCFSAISFLESEAIRLNKITDKSLYPDFSEMFVVSHSYQDRADKYIRMDGNLTFGAGSECEDVLDVMTEYGLVPQSVMPGNNYGTELPVHGEVDAVFIFPMLSFSSKTLALYKKYLICIFCSSCFLYNSVFISLIVILSLIDKLTSIFPALNRITIFFLFNLFK